MNKRVAALDLGTNTFHLLIAEVNSGKINKIIEEQRHVKLGEGGINKGFIAEVAYKRGIDALEYFKSVMDKFPVDAIKASGTAALRSAKNGVDFIEEAKKRTGITIDIIEGDREAGLIYKGVRAATDLGASSLIMDIGGGSVEFIFCSNKDIFWKKSYPIGAAKLMAAFHHSDPISSSDSQTIWNHLAEQLAELKDKASQFKPLQLVGSAGAFETFAALETERSGKNLELLNKENYGFNVPELKSVLEKIIKSTHQEREQNQLIIPVRTDMIVVASILTGFIIEQMHIEKISMSKFSLKEGLVMELTEVL